MKSGTKVRIRKEYCSTVSENDMDYVVVEDNGDRCLIEPMEWNWAIKPIENIRTVMLVESITKL